MIMNEREGEIVVCKKKESTLFEHEQEHVNCKYCIFVYWLYVCARLTRSVRAKRLITSTQILLLNVCRMSMLNSSLRRINTLIVYVYACLQATENERVNHQEEKIVLYENNIFFYLYWTKYIFSHLMFGQTRQLGLAGWLGLKYFSCD